MKKWEITGFAVGSEALEEYLAEGWEPFAVTSQNTSFQFNDARDTKYQSRDHVYLRRVVKEKTER